MRWHQVVWPWRVAVAREHDWMALANQRPFHVSTRPYWCRCQPVGRLFQKRRFVLVLYRKCDGIPMGSHELDVYQFHKAINKQDGRLWLNFTARDVELTNFGLRFVSSLLWRYPSRSSHQIIRRWSILFECRVLLRFACVGWVYSNSWTSVHVTKAFSSEQALCGSFQGSTPWWTRKSCTQDCFFVCLCVAHLDVGIKRFFRFQLPSMS